METDLIPFAPREIASETVQTVDGRDLHRFLHITRDYATWMKTWLKRAHLIQDRDYIVSYAEVENSKRRGEKPFGGRPSTDYFLTFDAAKCIGMMSGTPKGDEVRQYFLACEKELHGKPGVPTLHDPALQAIMHLTMDLDATKYRLAQVEHELTARQLDDARIEAKADAAFHNQNFWTIAEYVQYHDLRHQCPESAYVEGSRHMQAYCKRERLNFRDPNILPRRIPVGNKNWETEWGFHTSVYEAAFLPWLLRRQSQVPLHIIHTKEG